MIGATPENVPAVVRERQGHREPEGSWWNDVLILAFVLAVIAAGVFGTRFLAADTNERKAVFRRQCEGLPTIQLVVDLLKRRPERRLPGDAIREQLAVLFPAESASELFATLASFGRYAELLAYHAGTDELSLVETGQAGAPAS